ncbi:hypothetical protein [Halosolutus gelatinilyticus]|uniref:hypothetical protein n=1 Tax=Halosolutus gelatinilyticus TaxID=2931975 RepID=UPI001FF4E7D8|nr:hypothetical protein [Halosolutus gelatinilyticus]
MIATWLDGSVRIARIEWRRYRREFGHSRGRRAALILVFCATAVALGVVSWLLGRELATGGQPPRSEASLAAAIGFVLLAVRSSSLTNGRFEQLAPDALLTAVSARTATVGLVLFVFARVGVALAIPAIGVAVGLALGAGSAAVALSTIAAITALAAFAAAVGVAGRLAGTIVGRRLARGGLYRDLLVAFGWIPIAALWVLRQELSVPIDELSSWLEYLPLALLADLALLGAGERAGVEPIRGLAALGTVALAVPLLLTLATVFARRLWETDPAGSTRSARSSGSHSLVVDGRLERLLGEHVSRPSLVVARERLLAERRVPRGVLSAGYALCFVGLVGMPLFGVLLGAPGFVLVVFTLGLATGLVFGTEPIGKTYRVLPMLLTTVRGRDFVGGLLLASLVLGAPLIAAVVLLLGIASDASLAETLALICTGFAICACTATVNVAFEMNADRADLVRVPGFFIDVPVYSETGVSAFYGMAKTFAVVSVVTVPAFLGTSRPVFEPLAALGIPTAAVRIGALCCTIVLAIGVSRLAFRVAVDRYRDYHLE